MIHTYGRDRIAEDQVLRVVIEERLRDELALRNWWATTGKRLDWTPAPGMLPRWTDKMYTDHRARLRLLVQVLRAARKASR